ncbi:energy-coupling factor transporter transmembrane component T family protein [Pseudodesulfovibrio indicus]|uniref:Cobalt transporter n=1 Tax=Pseudodesulfovibrio indicus TaxID=1716143 RepID=A0A126QLY4_9BACT|nr:energy-coupling factor transporter transmembrane component T [Pseudodesulfovibrio indicus]AMK11073.1 cobalt transporter [Pseudodesulfovibrio indicus]TDT92087.1 energy-coupling factor transport system permease protein [Pseudodesulfovibrio indicus]
MADTSATLFVEGRSLVHGLNPLTKLAYILLAAALAYAPPVRTTAGTWLVCAVLLAVNGGLLASSGTGARAWSLLWKVMLPLALFMVPIHGLLHPDNRTALAAWHGVAVYREGLLFAGTVLLQVAVVLTASLLFVLCTHPADIVTSVTRAGLSPKIAYLVGSPLLMLPAMRARAASVQAAQRARGLDSEGGLTRRVRGLFPLVKPFLLGALMDIEQRAVALEVRGFNSRTARSAWREVRDSGAQRWARRLMLLGSLGLILYKAAGRPWL